jgi:hypothetical protein
MTILILTYSGTVKGLTEYIEAILQFGDCSMGEILGWN